MVLGLPFRDYFLAGFQVVTVYFMFGAARMNTFRFNFSHASKFNADDNSIFPTAILLTIIASCSKPINFQHIFYKFLKAIYRLLTLLLIKSALKLHPRPIILSRRPNGCVDNQ